MSTIRWAEEALNHLTVGVVLLAGDGHIAFANRTAEQLLQRGEGIRVRGGKLVANHPAQGARLSSLIARAAAGAAQALRLDRGAGRRPLHLLVASLPIKPESGQPAAAEPAIMAVVIDPEATGAPSTAMLQSLYGLTRSEACLARRLVMGERLEDYADHAGISMNTARTHLKAVFAKTDIDRQADLVRVLAWALIDDAEESSDPHQNG